MIEELAILQSEATGLDVGLLRLELGFCASIGCIEMDDDGFAAYFRCRHEDLGRAMAGDLAAIHNLPRSVLLAGPVMFIVDILAVRTGYAFHKMRALSKREGVERVVGYTRGHWFDQKARPCLG